MSDTNAAMSLPAPDAGGNQPQLNATAPPAAAPEEPAQTRGEFNKEVEAELSKATEICTAAQKAEYAGPLATRGIDAAFVTALLNLILACGQNSQKAVACDSSSKDATQSEADAAADLVSNLQVIQSAARLKHLPEHPALMEGYLVGEDLAESRPLLERNAQSLIDKGSNERPGNLDTAFFEETKVKRTTYMGFGNTQGGEDSKGSQARATREDLLKQVLAKRKKIQYAADSLWPSKKPASVQARMDFKLPQNRPYSY